jgi:non-specific riboncleoside hydrolase
MSRKIILDCDPGIDDALAICLALFDPRLEVLAITACAGNTDAGQATQNVHTLIERLDPPLMPRIGAALDPGPGCAVSNGAELHGERGLGTAQWAPVSRQHSIPSDKLMIDRLRANPDKVTVICTGPLTGLAHALNRDPAIAGMIDQVIIAGGSVNHIGNVTPTAEFNIHFDPASARAVFHSPITKILLPLEITRRLEFGWELVERLPGKHTRVGSILQELVPHLFRSTRQRLGLETVFFQAILPLIFANDSSLFSCQSMAGDVELSGELTRGTTVFDRRSPQSWRNNMEVVVDLEVESAMDEFYQLMKFVAR